MKNFILAFTVLLLTSFSLIAQVTNEEIEQLRQTNQEVITRYRENKFDDALKAGQQALEMTIKIFGAEHGETAKSYKNLGEIYRAKKKYKEAAENLQKALAIYQQNPDQNVNRIAETAESLGVVLTLGGKKEQAEEIFSQSLAAAEKALGSESKEILPFLKTTTEFYIYSKQFEKADEFFIRRFLIASKVFGSDSEELDKIEDERLCLTFQTAKPNEIVERNKKFREATRGAIANKSQTSVKDGVINGKAVSLPQPAYPARAREDRASGVFPVRIMIDEEGKVISAKSICGGHPALRESSEDAARKAKFQPTMLDGKPVKVNGIIVYNFVL
ncbi:MAG TPA: TonB family protein [Pyrinomonadaceae bacterium]|nr:TonB family protein [Pyrinomonadaceae bacterium]